MKVVDANVLLYAVNGRYGTDPQMLIIDWLSSLRSHSCAQAAGAIARIATQVDRKRRRMVNLRWLSADRTIPAHLESRNAVPSGWRIFDEPRDLWRPRCALAVDMGTAPRL